MSLSLASTVAQSTLASTATQISVVSRNIDGVNDPGYSRKIANLTTSQTGNGVVVSITRAADKALFDNLLGAQSGAAAQQALSDGVNMLDQTVGDPATGQSPSALLGDLADALQQYSASPSDTTLAQAAMTAASNVVGVLNNATTTIQGVRKQADTDMATAVQTVNSLLQQFQTANTRIVLGLQSGADITDAQDTRDSILSQLSQQVGISTSTAPNGSMSIYTDSGVTLFQVTARTVTFQPTTTFTAGASGNAVMVDGVPVTGSSSPMPIQSGKLAGLANLRDNVAVTYQSQLDEVARGLIDAFSESDQTGAGNPDAPGLFTYSGAPAMPAASVVPGLAGDIRLNASVDPSQGGNINLLRDGGIANTGAVTVYSYNTTGAASYSDRLQQMIDAMSATRSFDPSADLTATASLTDYTTSSASWLESRRQTASNDASYQATLVTNTSTALSNSTGVNLDTEMSKMLDLEHSYDASTKLISTIDGLFTSLFQAIG